MFLLDSLDNIERVSIYLSRPSGEPLACLDEYIDEQSANMVRGLNQQQELTFTINKQNNNWYEYIQEGMYLYVEAVGLFRMKQPSVSIDGIKETKTVNALSCDVELEDKNITLEINMGTKTSQEYLVQFDTSDADEEIVNPYTNVPYDWIVLYNTFPEQLTAHLNDYDNRVFGTPHQEITVTDSEKIETLSNLFSLIPRLKNKFTKTVDSATGSTNYTLVEYVNISTNSSTGAITSIKLFNTYRSRIVYLIDFYTRNRNKLSLIPMVLSKMGGSWSVGNIYGLSNNDYSLANKKYQFDVSSNLYSFLVSDFAQASNCMVTFDIFNRKVNVTPVENIGENTGITISYDNLLNSLEINADEDNLVTRLIVTGADDLSIEQVNFGLDYIDDLSYKMNAVDENGKRIYVTDELASKYASYITMRENSREAYIQLSKDYSNYEKQINEIKYRVPLDDLKTDWGTFTEDELAASLTTYKNLLASLISMYRTDYYPQGINQDDSVNEEFIKGTIYWYDYDAYKGIIKEIECAISTYPYYSDHDKWSSYNITLYEDAIKAWETEWTLYGTIELQAKIDAYKANMDLLAESSVIRTSSNSDTIKTWNDLTSAEKQQFGNSSANYQYDVYMAYYNNMVSAKSYLANLQNKIDVLESYQKAAQETRTSIVENVSLENNFTENELKILYLLFRDSDCSNENILVTTIDTVDKKVETMRELLEYGEEQLSRMSRPQLSFSISSDNLLSLKDYEPYWSDFKVGNYLMVQYRDDTFVKLRMIGYEYNPCLPSSNDFKITFSNSIRSKVGVTDLENLLGLFGSSSGRSSSGGSGGSGSGYGESDDIDVTISNTMLSKLLNSETFGTRVKDVILNTIDVNSLTAKYATFNGLANGVTTIDGQCITTGYIRDLIYQRLVENGTVTNGAITNTTGSIINLNDGKFNLGGRIKWDGSNLTIGDPSYRNLYIDNSNLQLRYGTTALADITTTGMTIKNSSGTQLASFGSTTTIGNPSYNNLYLTSSAMQLRYGTTARVDITSNGMTIYNSSGTQVAQLNSYNIIMGTSTTNVTIGSSNIYLRNDNVDIGSIGYGYYTNNTNLFGITLRLERATSTKKPAYAGIVATNADNNNTFKWIYLQDNATISGYTSGALNAGCDVDMNSYNLKDVGRIYLGNGNTTKFLGYNTNGSFISTAPFMANTDTNYSGYGFFAVGDIGCTGNLLVGNTKHNNTNYKLDVTGNSYIAGTLTTSGAVEIGGNLNVIGNIVNPYISGEIYSNGSVGLNSEGGSYTVYFTTLGNFRLDSDDDGSLGTSSYHWSHLYCTDSTIHTSDKKKKDNIEDIGFAEELIMNLKPVAYMWKKGDHRRKRMGFIAQDAAQVCKDINENLSLVTASYKAPEGKDEPDKDYFGEEVDDELLNWGMAKEELIAPMIKVMQMQDARIKEQNARIEYLESRIEMLI